MAGLVSGLINSHNDDTARSGSAPPAIVQVKNRFHFQIPLMCELAY